MKTGYKETFCIFSFSTVGFGGQSDRKFKFTFFCGAAHFCKTFEAPQRSVKIKIVSYPFLTLQHREKFYYITLFRTPVLYCVIIRLLMRTKDESDCRKWLFPGNILQTIFFD